MLQIRKIVFPTDFSPGTDEAFEHALFLAHRHGAVLHVLHVTVYPYPPLGLPDGRAAHFAAGKAWAEEKLEALLARHETEDVPVVRPLRRGEAAAPVILEYAAEEDVDLVVLTHHRRRGLDRLLMGSVAREVVHRASCPVLVVGTGEAAPSVERLRRILVPTDFSPRARPALRYAKELAELYRAEIDLLHVIQDVVWPSIYGQDPISLAVPEVVARVRQALREQAEAVLPGVPVDVHEMMGYPAGQILQFARDRKSDLIVLATHGQAGLRHLFLGSVAERVVQAAPCPVFVVRSYGTSLLGPEEARQTTAVPQG